MVVLSFLWSACSTAAIIVDGKIVSCTSEERYSRIKNDERFPQQAIHEAMDAAGIHASDIDLIALPGISWSPRYQLSRRYSVRAMENRMREQKEFWHTKIHERKKVDYYKVMEDFLDLNQFPGNWAEHIEADQKLTEKSHIQYFQEFRRHVISEFLGTDPSIVQFIHHHRAHAYYAYHASPTGDNPALVLTADAWGDDMNAAVYEFGPGFSRRISSSRNFMVARLYRHLTLLLGMKPDEHEFKVMGLAAYSKVAHYGRALEVLKSTQYVDGLGFDYHCEPPDLYDYFRERFEGERFDNIAGAMQHYAEDIIVEWASNALNNTGHNVVAVGGGIGMNVKAMLKIGELPKVKQLFIPPTPSDESLVIGSAFAGLEDFLNSISEQPPQFEPLENAYLGPDLDPRDISDTVRLAQNDPRLNLHERVSSEQIASRLLKGRILGRCVGRSEFGSRALGNRSIVADPRSADVVARINATIKSRDFWMPFAPTILNKYANRYLANPKGFSAGYMTLGFHTKDQAWEDLRAGLHPADRTCRPQILEKFTNPSYYELIHEFSKMSGVGGVLNTSFNVHGQPIIQTARHALDVLRETDLDMIQIENCLIEKEGTGR